MTVTEKTLKLLASAERVEVGAARAVPLAVAETVSMPLMVVVELGTLGEWPTLPVVLPVPVALPVTLSVEASVPEIETPNAEEVLAMELGLASATVALLCGELVVVGVAVWRRARRCLSPAAQRWA